MTGHQPQTSSATFAFIREHIMESEKRIPHPYPDIKGNVTIGIGFKIDNEDDFAKLELVVEKEGGKVVAATDTEKHQAFQTLQKIEEARKDTPVRKAELYRGYTNVRMPKTAMDAKLDQEIAKKIDGIRPKTRDAFDLVNKTAGSDKLTRRFGRFLGFLD